MRRTVLKSKLHRATVTSTDLHYEGSLTVDADLLDAADILENEQIHVWDVTNGTRLVTYALRGVRGSGMVQVNGAGAHVIKTGDIVIIATFTTLRTRVAKRWVPNVVLLGEKNRVKPATDLDLADPPPPNAGPATTPLRKGKRPKVVEEPVGED